jgi:integrase
MIHIDRHFDDQADILIAGRKNGASNTLPLDDETVKVLKVYTATRQPVGDLLFISRGGGRMSSGEGGV